MIKLTQKSRASIVLTGLSDEIKDFLQKSEILERGEESIHVLPDLDRGVEWCENNLLESTGVLKKESHRSIREQLRESIGDTEAINIMLNYLEKLELPEGVHLIHQGESPGAVYFLEKGMVTAHLETAGEEPLRLNTLSSENLVGELGFYLGSKRNASVVTDTPTTLYRLTTDALSEMEANDSEAAALFHKFIAQIMAEKLSHLMTTVETLMR
jgi:SulP family sulfate permease